MHKSVKQLAKEAPSVYLRTARDKETGIAIIWREDATEVGYVFPNGRLKLRPEYWTKVKEGEFVANTRGMEAPQPVTKPIERIQARPKQKLVPTKVKEIRKVAKESVRAMENAKAIDAPYDWKNEAEKYIYRGEGKEGTKPEEISPADKKTKTA